MYQTSHVKQQPITEAHMSYFLDTEHDSKWSYTDWNLILLATSDQVSDELISGLGAAIRRSGGWILQSGEVSPHCVDIDFEFPRHLCTEIYSSLLTQGLELSPDAHTQLADLFHCTQYVGQSARQEAARIHLSIYASDGAEAFLGSRSGCDVLAA
jgi:hypothetical protein